MNRTSTYIWIGIILVFGQKVAARQVNDSTKSKRWNFHFQQTVVTQYHPDFNSPYAGSYSLQPKEHGQISLTSTIFLAHKLWDGAIIYFNPEIAGGTGLSQARGVAGFPNGETFRIGDPKPQVYIARAFIKQIIPLSGQSDIVEDGPNQLGGHLPHSYISVSLGKFSVADYFDCNKYSHDPRSQFLNWALMSNGAWDYPANTRGYTYGMVVEYVKPYGALHLSGALVPTYANGPTLNFNISNSKAFTAELERNYKLGNSSGVIRLLGFFNQADMGNYKEATTPDLNKTTDVTQTRKYGRTKYGGGINAEQDLTKNVGLFFRASWNDGQNETWAFTEIDRSLSLGCVFNGNMWKRENDEIGIASVVNGISKPHQQYLAAGGHGFMIGDGKLNYSPENITEAYYSFKLDNTHLWITPNYQFIVNPGYNKDRGPVNVFGVRAHVAF